MITNIKLTNFRKHTNLEVALTEGLNVWRGANEAGKSSVLEGVAYCLFGSKALRNTLAETVTWGRKESELSAEVVLEVSGTAYTFTRSKAGAEVVTGGKVHVTGQNEVSTFAASLLGADNNAASKLMFATQGNLRGTLSEGPKATSAIIEDLASLDVIERIIDAAQEKLQLGSSAVLEERLKGVEAQVAALVVPAEPDHEEYDNTVQASLKVIEGAKEEAAAAEVAYKAAEVALTAEADKRKSAESLQVERGRLAEQHAGTSVQHAAEVAKAADVIVDPAGYEADVANAKQWHDRRLAYLRFEKMPKFEGGMNRGDHLHLITHYEEKGKVLQGEYTAVNTEIRIQEAQRITSDTCATCGQDTAHLPHVKAKKEQVEALLQQMYATKARIEAEDAENDKAFEPLVLLKADDAKALAGHESLMQYIEVDGTVIPARVTWKGEVPGDVGPDLNALQDAVAEIKAAIKARDLAQGKAEALAGVLVDITRRQAALEAKISALSLVSDDDFNALNSAFLAAAAARCEGKVWQLEEDLAAYKKAYEDQVSNWKAGTLSAKGLEDQVTQLKADIEAIGFNNNLVKKLRAARPVIANKVWGLVLSTVSVLFSQMRGEQSVVTKEKEGFMVNGRPVESLSGSTLDILGLAIRCALIKTFIPNCPFIVLDEPAQGCDGDRSAALIGYVAASGFTQTLVVTHDQNHDAVASNLIQL